jgi:hypothetical protein
MAIDNSRLALTRIGVNHSIRCTIAVCVLLLASVAARAADSLDCHIGSYRLKDGELVDVAPSYNDRLRWRRFDGATGALHRTANGEWTNTYGWTDRADRTTVSFSDCKSGRIEFAGIPGQRIAFDVTNTTFSSHDIMLAGRLVMPQGTGRVPVVVLLHGAEHESALTDYFLQRMLPAQGVGVFVYDKRGTGASGGAYSQDFSLLADDAVAALRETRRLAGARLSRVGYQAGSQGGWVAPIAASRVPSDFVIVCFGLAVSVIDEDRQEVEIEMREKGHSTAEIAQALEVAGAAETVIASGFTQGFKAFDAVRAKYRNAASRDGPEVQLGHALLLRSDAGLAGRHRAAIVDSGRRGLRGAERRDGSSHQIADRGRQTVHLRHLSARGTRHDAVRNNGRWHAPLDPLRAGLFRHDS